MVAIGVLFHKLYSDWNGMRTTEAYLSNSTPMDRLKVNAVFIFIAACLTLVFVIFGYLLLCKVTITPPFS